MPAGAVLVFGLYGRAQQSAGPHSGALVRRGGVHVELARGVHAGVMLLEGKRLKKKKKDVILFFHT